MAVSTGAYHPKPGLQAVGRGEPAQTTPFLPGLGRTLRQKPIKSATQCLHPAAHDSARPSRLHCSYLSRPKPGYSHPASP